MSRDLDRRLAAGAGIALAGDAAGKAINFVTMVVIARTLGADLFGTFSLALAVFAAAEVVGRMGLTETMLRFVPAYGSKGDQGRVLGVALAGVVGAFLAGSLVGAGLYFLAAPISQWFPLPSLLEPLRIFAFAVPFHAAMMVAAEVAKGRKRIDWFVAIKQGVHSLALLALVVAAVVMGGGLVAVTGAWVAAALLGLGVAGLVLRRLLPAARESLRVDKREILHFSLPVAGMGLLQLVFSRTDIVLLGYFRSPAEVGAYSAALQVTLLIGMVASAFAAIFSPLLAEFYTRRRMAEAESILANASYWTLLLAIPPFAVLVTVPSTVLAIFGESFTAAAVPLLVLAAAVLISVVPGPVSATLLMTGNQRVELWNMLAFTVGNALLHLLLIPRHGMLGAAVATSTSLAMIHLTRTLEVKALLGIRPFDRRHARAALAAAVALAGAFLSARWLDGMAVFPSLAIQGTVVSVTFGLCAAALDGELRPRRIRQLIRARQRDTVQKPES